MTQYVDAAGLLLFARTQSPKFLLMRHQDRWDLPKGHAEEGESVVETALRETEEETGVSRHAIEVDPDFRYVLHYEVHGKSRGTYQKRVTYLLGYLPSQMDITLTEHIGYQWWDWPAQGAIQSQTIDGLLRAAEHHFATFPQRLQP